MKRVHSFARFGLILLLLSQGVLLQVHSQAPAARPRRIAVWGSSVANGTGDEFGKEGYTGLLREFFAPRGWEVLNQSRGGDTTKTMAPRFAPEGAPVPNTRYLLPVNPGYVVIGLSLANEGIWEAKTKEDKEAVFKQYAAGIQGFIQRSRQNNIAPVVALVYPRMVYTPVEYEYVRRMNLLQNTWDVPTVNLLGALDDGAGRYTTGFDFDDKHPNASGHRELFYTFVPTLFEALEMGRPVPSRIEEGRGYARMVSSGFAPLGFSTRDTIHSFALSVDVRTQANGTVAGISGSTLSATSELKKAGARGQTEFESITLLPDRVPFNARIEIQNGIWVYTSAKGIKVSSGISADARWHHIALSHYTARGETLFYVDGKLAGKVAERLEPRGFVIGGSGVDHEGEGGPLPADYKELFLFRSALNADEVAALNAGKMVQASLEVYSPLTDAVFRLMTAVNNRAQSLSAFKFTIGRMLHVSDSPKH